MQSSHHRVRSASLDSSQKQRHSSLYESGDIFYTMDSLLDNDVVASLSCHPLRRSPAVIDLAGTDSSAEILTTRLPLTITCGQDNLQLLIDSQTTIFKLKHQLISDCNNLQNFAQDMQLEINGACLPEQFTLEELRIAAGAIINLTWPQPQLNAVSKRKSEDDYSSLSSKKYLIDR